MKDKSLTNHWEEENQDKPEVPNIGGSPPAANENKNVGGQHYGVIWIVMIYSVWK